MLSARSIGPLLLACAACSSPADVADGGDASPDAIASDAGDAGDGGPTQAEQAEFAQLLGDTQGFLSQSGSPGASIAIVLHGKLAFASGVGLRNVAKNQPVTTSTLFRVASMSKMVVAATAMTLVEEGKLDLGAPITTYVPWFHLASGYDATQITTSLLLSHASGFPCDTIPQCGATSSGTRESFFTANPQPLWAPPGAIYDYSNTGFTLAASVVEAAAGTGDGTYETLAHDRVFVPTGMTTATFDAQTVASADHATGYDLDGNGKVVGTEEPNQLDCPLLNPPGGIEATATDYAHFAEMLLASGGATLKPSSVQAMESPHANMHTFASQEYGYGLVHQFAPYADHDSIWHDGSLPGFLSEFWVIPDDGFAVIALVNARGGDDVPDEIVGDALGLFIPENRPGVTLTTPSSTWSKYEGTYDDSLGTLGAGLSVTLVTDAGPAKLVVDAPAATPAPVSGAMTQAAIDTWVMPDGTGATFFPAADGGVGYFVTRRGVGLRE